jgi:hypothetical protein
MWISGVWSGRVVNRGSATGVIQVRRFLHAPILELPVRATTLLNQLLDLAGAVVDPGSWQVGPGGGEVRVRVRLPAGSWSAHVVSSGQGIGMTHVKTCSYTAL